MAETIHHTIMRVELTLMMRKEYILALVWLTPFLAVGESFVEERYRPYMVYQLKAEDSLDHLIQRFWNQTNGIDELLHYNQIDDASTVKEGDHIIIPLRSRRSALVEIEAADALIELARDAAAPEYAGEEYGWADRLIRGARASRVTAAYQRAAARARLAGVWASEAKKLADERAVVQEKALIRVVYGTVQWRSKTNGWASAEKGRVLEAGDRVLTGKDSRAEIELADGSIIQLQAESEFELEDLRIDQRNGVRGTALKVRLGEILGTIKKKKEASKFKINSHASTIGVRGTELKVSTGRDQVSRLSVLKGDTELTAGGRLERIKTNFGSFARLNLPPSPPIELLPPPEGIEPAAPVLNTARQQLTIRWKGPDVQPPPSFRFELARDPEFNQIVQDERVRGEEITTQVLEEGRYLWRICSVDKHKLEGPYTKVFQVNIGPDLGVEVVFPTNAIQRNGQWIVGPTTRFELKPAREDTSVGSFDVDVDGEGFKVSPEAFTFPGTGARKFSVRGVGLDQKVGKPFVLEARLDEEAPKPRAELTFDPKAERPEDRQRMILTATDDTGVRHIEYSLDGVDFQIYRKPVSLGRTGARDIRFRAVDMVGNISKDQTLHLMGSF
ncbi:MAG: FecR family protein [Verrucomicrobiota bacterium]